MYASTTPLWTILASRTSRKMIYLEVSVEFIRILATILMGTTAMMQAAITLLTIPAARAILLARVTTPTLVALAVVL